MYEIEASGEVKEAKSTLPELGLECVLADLRRKDKNWADIDGDFDHIAAENVLWNSTSGILTFDVFARPNLSPRQAGPLASKDCIPCPRNGTH